MDTVIFLYHFMGNIQKRKKYSIIILLNNRKIDGIKKRKGGGCLWP